MPSQKWAYISGNFLYIMSQVLHGVPISGTFGGMEQATPRENRRVFRSDADVVGTPAGEDCFSSYGKAMQWSNWTPHLTEFLSKIHNSTKNCSGGFLGCNHQKSKRAETTHESHLCKYHCLVHSPSSDKRWAIREAGFRINRIWVLSSTHWAGKSKHAQQQQFVFTSITFAGCHE